MIQIVLGSLYELRFLEATHGRLLMLGPTRQPVAGLNPLPRGRLAGLFPGPRILQNSHPDAITRQSPLTVLARYGRQAAHTGCEREREQARLEASNSVPQLVSRVAAVLRMHCTVLRGFSGSTLASWGKSGDTRRLGPLPLNTPGKAR